jgi:coenzyme F420 hydrogenase subunit beta
MDMRVFGSNELMEDVQGRELCIGCGACVELCPYFRNYRGKTARMFACTLTEGRCFAHCPKAEVDLGELANRHWGEEYQAAPLGKYIKIVAARAGKNAPKGRYQGGGTVSALVGLALRENVIDAAVLTGSKAMEPLADVVTDPDRVPEYAASKFTAAPTLAAMNRGVAAGYKRLGVVGTPCQMTAVAKMRMNPLNREEFSDPIGLAVGLFCNWALDTRSLARFLSTRFDLSKITGMDIPPPPANVLVVETAEGKTEISLDEIRSLIPETCFICPDMTSEWADVSVGMYEGRPGWNTLIIRTERGADLVDKAVETGWLDVESFPEENAAHLSDAARLKKERALRTAQKRGVLNTEEEGKRAALRIPVQAVESVLAG